MGRIQRATESLEPWKNTGKRKSYDGRRHLLPVFKYVEKMCNCQLLQVNKNNLELN